MQVLPYLYFNGRCQEALDFYREALGAQIESAIPFRESPDASMIPPGAEDKIMHASLRIGETTLMASDGMCQGDANFQGISLSLSVADVAQAEQVFNALADAGQIQMPLTESFFSPRFGMVADRFGVSWMVIVQQNC